jgi:hypothetical protein
MEYTFNVNTDGLNLDNYEKYLSKFSNWKENKREINKIKYDAEQYKIAEKVFNADIDFTKFGWVNQVSNLTGKKHQKINSWMKRYLPEIYEKSYKRKQ